MGLPVCSTDRSALAALLVLLCPFPSCALVPTASLVSMNGRARIPVELGRQGVIWTVGRACSVCCRYCAKNIFQTCK
jgi:hypothetical protein